MSPLRKVSFRNIATKSPRLQVSQSYGIQNFTLWDDADTFAQTL